MDIREAINILESALSFKQLGNCNEAWQTLKTAVSEQTAHNNARDEILLCDSCVSKEDSVKRGIKGCELCFL